MRLAWFRASAPNPTDPLDDLAGVITRLGHTHEIELFTATRAHDFVWRHALRPFDLCVYELAGEDGDQFIWAYLFNYPGVLILRREHLHDSRSAILAQRGRVAEYLAEFRFNHGHLPPPFTTRIPRGRWPMRRAPMLASRLVAVPDDAAARSLRAEFPHARIRHVPIGAGVDATPTRPFPRDGAVRFAVFGNNRRRAADLAVSRARVAGAPAELLPFDAAVPTLTHCDAVLALTWPREGESLAAALLGMSMHKPVVVFDMEATAVWPALDPQTWHPRGIVQTRAPIVISIDPRDEEHSLMLTVRRLSCDRVLRDSLGETGHAWWRHHGTLGHAAAAWHALLDEALNSPPPAPPSDWPTHLRGAAPNPSVAILEEFGISDDPL